MDNRPVGIFDSGLGGLTSLAAFRKLMPDEDIIFFGDTANCPYGVKSREEIELLTEKDIEFLSSKGVKAALIACGTISANALNAQKNCPFPLVNVVSASLNEINLVSGSFGIIATDATVRSKAFEIENKTAFSTGCRDFVRLIESGITDRFDEDLISAVRGYLPDLMDISALVLGCTHFGLIEDAIRDHIGPDIQIIEAAACGARAFAQMLQENNMTGGHGNTEIYTSGDLDGFNKQAERILHAKGCNYKPAQRAFV